MKILRKLLKKLFEACYAEELAQMRKLHTEMSQNCRDIHNILGNLDVSADIHMKSGSWAVVSIQGKKTDYIKFIDLHGKDVLEIQRYLSLFDRERVKIDANPFIAKGIKDHLYKINHHDGHYF